MSLADRITVHHAPSPGTHHARSPYVERYWLPTLGPTCVALLRRLALDAETGGAVSHYDKADLAECLGLGTSGAALAHALDRLARFRLAYHVRDVDDGTEHGPISEWAIAVTLPPVDPKHYRRLPESLRDEIARGPGSVYALAVVEELEHQDERHDYEPAPWEPTGDPFA